MNFDRLEDEDAGSIARYFNELAVCNELSSAPLPSADLIWWRSQLAEKRRLARRSVLAIDTVRIAAIVISAAFFVLAMVRWAPQLFGEIPMPLPLTLASLVLFACSTGGVLLVWARQR